MQHSFDMKIYVSETDLGGVTYYANYLKYIEHARTEFYNEMGYKQLDMLNNLNIGFMVSRTNVEYKAPSTLDDRLIITTQVGEINKTNFSINHKIYKNTTDSKPITLVSAVLVCVNAKTLRPTQMPEGMRDALSQYVEA